MPAAGAKEAVVAGAYAALPDAAVALAGIEPNKSEYLITGGSDPSIGTLAKVKLCEAVGALEVAGGLKAGLPKGGKLCWLCKGSTTI